METKSRKCTRCGVTKLSTLEFFPPSKDGKCGLKARCRDCMREYIRNWQRKFRATEIGKKAKRDATRRWEKSEEGRAKHLAATRAWRAQNREKLRRLARERYAAETEERRRHRYEQGYTYRKRMRADKPVFRLRLNVSSRIAQSLQSLGASKRSRSWEQVVGYTLADLRKHLERQFVGRMSWANYGKWHIDHIVPVSSFDVTSADDDAFRACWALTNLRPLWARENLKKHATRVYLI